MKKEANFKVHSPFEPAGDQPKAIKALSDSILKGNRYQALDFGSIIFLKQFVSKIFRVF